MHKIYSPFSIMGIVFIILLFSLAFFSGCRNEHVYDYPFQDPHLALDERVNDLVGRLTLEEKASIMLYNSVAIDRLGIPAYNWWNECLHGVARAGKATVFPQAIGLAATWNPDLMNRIGSVIADEARAKYNASIRKGNRGQYAGLTFWTPNINIFRDPRWGRGQETYGEDPYLTGEMGAAFVNGLQGDNPRYLKAAACAKHYVVHSGPEQNRHHFNALPTSVDFYETYLPGFKKLVESGVESVMCAYNRTYDLPCCGSPYLLDDILRKQWGFQGHIVSDCWALDDFFSRHKVVADEVESAAMAARAGVNLNCGYIYKYLPEAVERGLISENTIDSILKPLLNTRFKLGLFDPEDQVPFSNISADIVNCKPHRALAYEAAAQSIVMLKNKNHVLPLDKAAINNILILGPTSADIKCLLGNYNGYSGEMTTFLEGIVEAASPGTIVEHNQGFMFHNDSLFHGFWQASRADALIACIGINALFEGEENDAMLNPLGGDRGGISLPANQVEYIKMMKARIGDVPLIVVITGGSAIAIPEIDSLADAILFAWYPGEAGGNAVADVLFGDVNPSGRLPVTFYKSDDDLPPFEDYSMEERTYKYFTGNALYPFGYGLSYSSFEYSEPVLNFPGDDNPQKAQLSVNLKNTGDYDGNEVVQVYVRKINAPFPQPVKELLGFQRIHLIAGSMERVNIDLEWDILKYWNVDQQVFLLDPGKYELMIGSSSADIKLL
ncbi:MAG: glycoside hydrolase family 3 N-terminal domain-containing protein, partial [Bacteroidota bacterium]|nr:glycoside hydrolase family 3 N-terminal domain-containing protein [Bacteroidota bacterium]